MSTPTRAPLREVLAGQLATKHGSLPKIQLPGDDSLNTPFIEEAAAIIRESHTLHPDRIPHLYRRDILPVYPIPEKRRFKEMLPEYFVSWTDRHFAPYKTRHDRNGDAFDVIKPMPKETAKACLNSHEFVMALPAVLRTYPTPVPVIPESGGPMRLCAPGYDADSGAYVFPSDFTPDPAYIVDDGMPSSSGYYDDRMSLGEAVRYLHRLHSNFPLSDWSEEFAPAEDNPFFDPAAPDAQVRLSRSLAVQIMAMLSIFAAGCAPQKAIRLGFAYNANKQRSGKTLMVKMSVSPVYGSFKAQSWREDEENMLKILDAETLAGSTYICFDNIRGLVASQPLEGFMTAANWTGRILGRSEMFEAENNSVIFLTANNTSFGPDMQERVLIVDLYVETADRQDREVELAPEDEIDEVWLSDPGHRRKILSALWAIVRHWDHAGRPLATGKPRKGFGTWCRLLGGMVEFAGFGDPLERPKNLENCGDSETDDVRSLIAHLTAEGRSVQKSFQELVDTCWTLGLFHWCMHGKEDYVTELERVSLKLSDACNSKFGILLQRNCSGERGEIHVFKSPDGRSERRVRFYCKGKGRSRKYHFDIQKPSP